MLTELRTFIAVVRHGTFAAAGGHIGLTQSAVSSQIKRLEDALGFALFDRTRRTATLNAAGSMTLPRAQEIVALFGKLSDLPLDVPPASLLRIGAIASVQSSWLPRALGAVCARYPGLRLGLVPGVSMHLMDQLDAGELDVAILIRPPFGLPPELRWQTLLRETFMLLVPAALAGGDWREVLQTQPFLRYDRKSFGGRLVDRFLTAQQLVVHEFIELDEIQGMVQLVANGLGVALLPISERLFPLPDNVRAMALGKHTFYREVGMLTRIDKSQSPLLSTLTQCLLSAAA